MGIAGLRKAARYGWDDVTDQVERLYVQLVEGTAGKAKPGDAESEEMDRAA
jgi:hypothetical protein